MELVVEFGFVSVVQITLVLSYVGVDLDENGDQEVHHDDHNHELVQGPCEPDEAKDGAILEHPGICISIFRQLRRPRSIFRRTDVTNGVAKSNQKDLEHYRKTGIAKTYCLATEGLI